MNHADPVSAPWLPHSGGPHLGRNPHLLFTAADPKAPLIPETPCSFSDSPPWLCTACSSPPRAQSLQRTPVPWSQAQAQAQIHLDSRRFHLRLLRPLGVLR